MSYRRFNLASSLIVAGGSMLAIGIILLMVKILITLAWYAAGAIALVGLLMLSLGWIIGGGRK